MTGSPARLWFAAEMSEQLLREHAMPAFHPHEQRAQAEDTSGQSLVGERAAGHVRPEEQQRQHEGQSPDIVTDEGGARRGAQQLDGFLDQFDGASFILKAPAFHGQEEWPNHGWTRMDTDAE